MKTIKLAYSFYKFSRQYPGVLRLVTDIFDFLRKTSDSARPMYCKLAFVNTKTGEHLNDFVSLWAGIGESNPIERLQNVVKQRDVAKDLLKRIRENHELTEEEKISIDLIERHFI